MPSGRGGAGNSIALVMNVVAVDGINLKWKKSAGYQAIPRETPTPFWRYWLKGTVEDIDL